MGLPVSEYSGIQSLAIGPSVYACTRATKPDRPAINIRANSKDVQGIARTRIRLVHVAYSRALSHCSLPIHNQRTSLCLPVALPLKFYFLLGIMIIHKASEPHSNPLYKRQRVNRKVLRVQGNLLLVSSRLLGFDMCTRCYIIILLPLEPP